MKTIWISEQPKIWIWCLWWKYKYVENMIIRFQRKGKMSSVQMPEKLYIDCKLKKVRELKKRMLSCIMRMESDGKNRRNRKGICR
ncbi:MAG: hypothetical protein Q4C50_03390 [Eubacteriales bacterium]|nr:hypothetical protein [Eubacteriales bacterium]